MEYTQRDVCKIGSEDEHRRDAIITLLERAHYQWTFLSYTNEESVKVSLLLEALIDRVKQLEG
jgi:hypothetical protein